MEKSLAQTSSLFSIPFWNGSSADAISYLRERWNTNAFSQICTPNPEHVIESQKNAQFLQVLKHAELNLPDGVGIVWASAILGKKVNSRIAGREFFFSILDAFGQQQTVLLLGGRDQIASLAATQLQKMYPQVTWISDSGSQDIAESLRTITYEKEKNEAFIAKPQSVTAGMDLSLRSLIESTHPSIVFVAYGAPWQELWIHMNRVWLSHQGVKIAMGVGGTLDQVTGAVSIAPRLFVMFGLEWFWRLLLQPWRFKRQLRLLQFVWLTMRQRFV